MDLNQETYKLLLKALYYFCHLFHTCAAGINECETVTCAPDATCIDTLGNFECQCNEGFGGDGSIECILLGECHQNNYLLNKP